MNDQVSTTELTNDLDNLSLQQSPINGSPIQRLPNECLYSIIDYFSSDLKGLHSLLLVNKFFFHVAVQHMYNNPFVTWEMRGSYIKRAKQEYLFTNVLMSFLQARVIESINSPNNTSIRDIPQLCAEFLKTFGLKLVLPFNSKGIVIQESNDDFDSTDHPQTPRIAARHLTIDYSKLFTDLDTSDWSLIQMSNIIRLEVGDSGSTPFLTTSRESNYRNSNRAIMEMWMCFNCNTITTLTIETSQAHTFLPHAAKLSSLKTIQLHRDQTLLPHELESTLMFITMNQSAFPMKHPLHIVFGKWWEYSLSDQGVFEPTMDLNLYFERKREFRDWNLQYMRPRIQILEAIQKPRVLVVHHVPKFYDLADNIDTSRLVELYDRDQERHDLEEGKSINEFLRRSVKIKKLDIGVSHPDVFSWTIAEQQQQQQQQQQLQHQQLPVLYSPLMKVEDLTIWSNQVYHAAIKAFNEAMRAFAPSLRTVKLHQDIDYQEYKAPIVARNLMTLRSLQLQRVPIATKVGDFPSLLPNLTSLKIILENALSIGVGSFSACPNLEEFHLYFGSRDNLDRRPQEEEPTQLPIDGHILNSDWRHAKADYTLFPVWNFPKLKILKLGKMASMRFDLSSLPLMQSLESLDIKTYFNSITQSDYLIRQHKIPQEQPPIITTEASSSSIPDQAFGLFGVFGSHSYMRWILPNLTSIAFENGPSVVFCLEYLRLFPKLTTLSLGRSGTPIELYRNPMVVVADSKSHIPSLEGYFPEVGMFDDTPIMDSQLKTLTLSDSWIMTDVDIVSLLTIYAPHLERLSVTKLHGYEENGYRFLEAINNADIENDVFGMTEGDVSKLPGRKLKNVKCNYLIREREVKELGFRNIFTNEVEKYEKKGYRVYQLYSGVALVRESEFALLGGSKNEEAASTKVV